MLLKKYSIIFSFLICTSIIKAQLVHNNPKDTAIVLSFKSGKYELDSISKKQLENTYKKLIVNDDEWFYVINIYGFADEKGKDSSNYSLSKKRAVEAGKYLISLSNDTVIKKIGTIDGITQCNGVVYTKSEYKVPISYNFWGELFNDSLNVSRERKVLLRFKDNRGGCLGTFEECKFPDSDKIFTRDSTIQIFIPSGYIDSYTKRVDSKKCKYDENSILTLKFIDSLPTKENLCEKIISSFKTKQKKNETKIGSISFLSYLNDTLISNPVCKTNYYNEHKIAIRFSAKLIPCDDYILYTSKHELLEYKIKDGFIETFLNLNETQRIDVFIKNSAFKSSKLVVKGAIEYLVSTKEPIHKCDILFDKKGSIRNLFSKKTTYSILKFAKEETNIYLLNPLTNQVVFTNLKNIKYSKAKNAYILSRKALKKLQKEMFY